LCGFCADSIANWLPGAPRNRRLLLISRSHEQYGAATLRNAKLGRLLKVHHVRDSPATWDPNQYHCMRANRPRFKFQPADTRVDVVVAMLS